MSGTPDEEIDYESDEVVRNPHIILLYFLVIECGVHQSMKKTNYIVCFKTLIRVWYCTLRGNQLVKINWYV